MIVDIRREAKQQREREQMTPMVVKKKINLHFIFCIFVAAKIFQYK